MLTCKRSELPIQLVAVTIMHTINVFYVGVETTTFSLTTIDNKNSILITSVTVGVLAPILIILLVMVFFVTFVLLIRKNGKMQ